MAAARAEIVPVLSMVRSVPDWSTIAKAVSDVTVESVTVADATMVPELLTDVTFAFGAITMAVAMPALEPLTSALIVPPFVWFELVMPPVIVANWPTEIAVETVGCFAVVLPVADALIVPVFRSPPWSVVGLAEVAPEEPMTTAVATSLALRVALVIAPRLIKLKVPGIPPGSDRPPITIGAAVRPPNPGSMAKVGELPVLWIVACALAVSPLTSGPPL